MYLEIVSPEATFFSSEVDSVTVPGVEGEFQMLQNHAPIVSLLTEGTVKVRVHTQPHLDYDKLHPDVKPHMVDNKVLLIDIKSGTLEMKDNKVIILAD
ncbi:F0F1 ATP synthase subunit epsilon [Tamlana sp. 2_MG-2023]|uniref:F0F1 ATP synthase subunit epsilon n=1 Tax=unclassified Tamlana TaxID=2614803 RepID=UPI0026E1B052|nr:MULTISPECIES: F0F1 ATP synthase subunit epsilon [unclassified Tamlana]MDO6759885.1 F0F1 ATP synthase subunit epsilon [Tamlana sp. 2_MG-2023]MDO6791945.1 F0F1 ATP synthase subunit epsilon [Tamlana sp. 1_MG-2023]